MPFPLIALTLVGLLIVMRRVGPLPVKIWHAMTFGAILVTVSGSISPTDAWHAIDFEIIFFLFGMFVLGVALVESGLLSQYVRRLLGNAKTGGALVVRLLLAAGLASALLMNDTLAIAAAPIALNLARRYGLSVPLLLLALAFAITIGSVMSPIGNPQNLLIALHGGVDAPFLKFAYYLGVPTLLNFAVAFYVLRVFYPESFRVSLSMAVADDPVDPELARLARWGLGLVIAVIIAKVLAVGVGVEINLSAIAIAGAAPVVLFSQDRWRLVKRVDWQTLVFFCAMFVLMASVWQTGFFQRAVAQIDGPITNIASVFSVSVLLSQLISNVPLVALYQPVLLAAGGSVESLMALAAGSTIAGNFMILGAASNVIIIQCAERYGESLGFWQFARVGIPLTMINVIVYVAYFWLLGVV